MPTQGVISHSVGDFTLAIPRPKTITIREELDLVQQALAKDPKSLELRYRASHLLSTLDKFDEALAILQGLAAEVNAFRVHHLLGVILLARETNRDSRAAIGAATSAVGAASDDIERSRALALLGKAHLRLSQIEQGRARLIEALSANPARKDAYKRLAMLDLQAQRVQEASDYAERMVGQGVRHARVLGVRPLAFAMLGRLAEAHEAFGLTRFLRTTDLMPPPGWPTIEAFNRALAAELLAHPGIRYERYGVASARSWRIDEPALARSRLVPELHSLIARAVTDYVAELPAPDDPWLHARPSAVSLRSWCVMADGEGFEEWHVHQNGWLSGAYYVDVPHFVVNGDGTAGCIAFGIPPGIVGENCSAIFGDRLFRPHSGMLILFPSHSFHRTFPHRGDHRRICFAFDIAADSLAT